MSDYWHLSLILERDRLFLVDAFARNGKGAKAIEIYSKIPEDLRDAVSHGCVLNACSHAGLIEEARRIFDQIPTKTKIICTTMVRVPIDRVYLCQEQDDLDWLSCPGVHVRRSPSLAR